MNIIIFCLNLHLKNIRIKNTFFLIFFYFLCLCKREKIDNKKKTTKTILIDIYRHEKHIHANIYT